MQASFSTKDLYDRGFDLRSSLAEFIDIPRSSDGVWETFRGAWIDDPGPLVIGSQVHLRSRWASKVRIGIIVGLVEDPMRMLVLMGPWHDDLTRKKDV